MEAKYYTPKAEEFHLGFEFECHIDNGLVSKIYYNKGEEWKATKWNLNDYLWSKEISLIRVKYLDEEDIEELGWDRDLDSPQRYEREGYIMHGFTDDGIWAIKEIRQYEKHGTLLNTYDTLFEGKIKNKSELKRLMVQLGIIQEQ